MFIVVNIDIIRKSFNKRMRDVNAKYLSFCKLDFPSQSSKGGLV